MLIRLLDSDTPIPAGPANSVLRLKVFPQSGSGWRMFAQNFGFVARGRFETIGTGMTSISVRIAADNVGAPSGLEANIVTINSTSIAQGTSYPLPIIDLLQGGVSSSPSIMHLVLGFGFPVRRLEVLDARAGMGFTPGENLLARSDKILLW